MGPAILQLITFQIWMTSILAWYACEIDMTLGYNSSLIALAATMSIRHGLMAIAYKHHSIAVFSKETVNPIPLVAA